MGRALVLPEQRKTHKRPLRPFRGVADPRYLLAEIEELRDIAQRRPAGPRKCAECGCTSQFVDCTRFPASERQRTLNDAAPQVQALRHVRWIGRSGMLLLQF